MIANLDEQEDLVRRLLNLRNSEAYLVLLAELAINLEKSMHSYGVLSTSEPLERTAFSPARIFKSESLRGV